MATLVYFDLGVFVVIFFMMLMANFTERSVMFNLVISGAFLSKVMISAHMRSSKSFSVVRKLTVIRLGADCLILPLLIYFKYFTKAYTYNYFVVLIILALTELGYLMHHFRHLGNKSIIECLEQISPS